MSASVDADADTDDDADGRRKMNDDVSCHQSKLPPFPLISLISKLALVPLWLAGWYRDVKRGKVYTVPSGSASLGENEKPRK